MFTRPQPMTAFDLPWGPNHHFKVEGHHFTSLCSSLPSNIPSYTEMPQSSSPTQLRRRLWSADRYPYLAFSLQFPFVGQWARFATPADRIGLVHDRHGWHLPRETQKEWKNFEHIIRASAERIVDFLQTQFVELSDLWDLPPKPGSFGYFTVQSTEAEARQAVGLSIDAFLVYLAYISFLFALHYYYPATRKTEYPRASFQQLVDVTGIKLHLEWLRDLEASPVAQFRSDTLRVGSVINIMSCKWLNLVPFMITARIPIWLYWGCPPFNASFDLRLSWVDLYTPPIDEPSHPTLPIATKGPASSYNSNFPPIPANSRQRPGEFMRAYFERRKERHKRLMEKETPLQKQARLDREKAQANKQIPGKKGPTVFYWEKTGEFNIRIRTHLSRALAKSLWNLWPNKAIVYDSFTHEFDCCSEWSFDAEDTAAPSTKPENEFPDDELDDYNPPVLQGAIHADRETHPPTPTPPEVQDVLMHDNPETHSHTSPVVQDVLHIGLPILDAAPPVLQDVIHDGREPHPPTPPEVQDALPASLYDLSKQDVLSQHPLTPSVQPPPQSHLIEDLIYYRYGYNLNETPYQGPSPAFAKSPNHFEDWSSICGAVGGKGLSASQNGRAPITDFLVALLASKEPFHDVPGKYWDLSPGNSEPLKSFTPIHLRITIRKFQDGTLCLLQGLPSQGSTTDWYIAVEPMIALECIRHASGPSLIDVAQSLLREGIPFRTLSPLSELPKKIPSPTSSRQFLGYRPYKYKFDVADFAAYETFLESFLLAQPQGRRALCYGGIVGRLARETLADSVALAGPSDSALQGQQESFRDGEDLFVDDLLSDKELDLICGTYDVGTGSRGMSNYFPPYA